MRANKAQFSSSYSNTTSAQYFLETKSFSFTDEARATPVQDIAQRRHRRRRAAGTRCKDSFQIKTLRKPFLLSLVATYPLVFSNITKEEAGVLACGHVRIFASTCTLGAFFNKECCFACTHKDRTPQGVFGILS